MIQGQAYGWFVISISVLMFLLGCSPRAIDYDQVGPNDKLIIRFSHVTGEETPKGLAAKRFKELVEAKSGGKIEVQVFPNSTLYSDKEELSALKRGDIQIIAPAISKVSSVVPEALLFDLPYLFHDQDDVWKLADGPVGDEINILLEKQGYKMLAVWDNGFKQITNNKHPIHHPDDFKDLSFRIMPSRVLARQFDSVGATSLVLPFNELYQALERGQVDGEENTVSNIYSKKLYVTQKYMTKSDHGYLGYFVLTQKEFWESIPQESRVILEEVLADVTEWERNLALEIDKTEYAYLKERKNLELYELTEEEKKQWRSAFYPTYEWFVSQIHDDLIKVYIKEIFEEDFASKDK
ncbi:DctP family TRAP transporter solute-binding subunit [Ammoniphilus sp. CFH 90114]|uniref:DctP family TRAP transporter solute-binding subunit n=1 Tax=Ammoniphilus sp. CFH 90114 TaxID=2493665 RepID=UPI00100DE6B4|nr:DctP family TRAP transporter solute-binding subunit [Ammoniphilus sp. CFH 90114]RXT09037.1 DctP family TRAP transporter solute-binding subunit [Ammoniphilus sp. CFH 90114]